MKDKFSFSYYCLVLLLLLLPILLLPHRSRIYYNEEYRDTIIFNVTYRDTTIYNIDKKDSTIYNCTLVELNDTVRINDTLYMSLPISWYWFKDEYADVFCTGYNVSLDSVNYHIREVTKMVEKEIIIRPKKFTADAGLMIGKSMGSLYIDLDVAAHWTISDKWSLSASAGLTTIGYELSPFAEIGLRCKFR